MSLQAGNNLAQNLTAIINIMAQHKSETTAYDMALVQLKMSLPSDITSLSSKEAIIKAANLSAAWALIDAFNVIKPYYLQIPNDTPGTPTPFSIAITNYQNRPEDMQRFLDHFIDNGTFDISVLGISGSNMTPIDYLVTNNYIGAIEYLFSKNSAGMQYPGANGYHLLTLAAIAAKDYPNFVPLITKLVQQGFEVDKKNLHGDTATQIAALHHSHGGLSALIDNGADVNLPFTPQNNASIVNTGRSPFMLACINHSNNQHSVLTKLAMHSQFNIKAKSADGNTNLHYSAMTNNLSIMKDQYDDYISKYPGENPADIKNFNSTLNFKYGTPYSYATPFHVSAANPKYSLATMKWLGDKTSTINDTFTVYLNEHTATINTALTAAAQHAYYTQDSDTRRICLEKANYLINNDAFTNYEFVDTQGFNSIHWILSFGSSHLLHKLLERIEAEAGDKLKLLINAPDNEGKTPLKWEFDSWSKAVKVNNDAEIIIHKNMLIELIEHGASSQGVSRSDAAYREILVSVKGDRVTTFRGDAHDKLVETYCHDAVVSVSGGDDALYA